MAMIKPLGLQESRSIVQKDNIEIFIGPTDRTQQLILSMVETVYPSTGGAIEPIGALMLVIQAVGVASTTGNVQLRTDIINTLSAFPTMSGFILSAAGLPSNGTYTLENKVVHYRYTYVDEVTMMGYVSGDLLANAMREIFRYMEKCRYATQIITEEQIINSTVVIPTTSTVPACVATEGSFLEYNCQTNRQQLTEMEQERSFCPKLLKARPHRTVTRNEPQVMRLIERGYYVVTSTTIQPLGGFQPPAPVINSDGTTTHFPKPDNIVDYTTDLSVYNAETGETTIVSFYPEVNEWVLECRPNNPYLRRHCIDRNTRLLGTFAMVRRGNNEVISWTPSFTFRNGYTIMLPSKTFSFTKAALHWAYFTFYVLPGIYSSTSYLLNTKQLNNNLLTSEWSQIKLGLIHNVIVTPPSRTVNNSGSYRQGTEVYDKAKTLFGGDTSGQTGTPEQTGNSNSPPDGNKLNPGPVRGSGIRGRGGQGKRDVSTKASSSFNQDHYPFLKNKQFMDSLFQLYNNTVRRRTNN